MRSTLQKKGRIAIFLSILSRFVTLNLVVLVVLFILRACQYVSLSSMHALPSDAMLLEWRGYIQDLVLWLILSWFLLIPFFLLSLLKRWIGIAFFSLVFFTVAISEWSLFQYFKITLTPLDQVVFSYTVREMAIIAQDSAQVNFFAFLPFILIGLMIALFIRISWKVRLPYFFIGLFFILSLSACFFRKSSAPKEAESRNLFEYYLVTNKCAYLIDKFNLYFSSSKQTATIASVEAAARRYQAAHPEFEFTGTRFPFLHIDRTPDALSPFFNLGKEKPDLVFVIVESLSACFVGNNQIFGSFTPFLDSLSGHSLFWNNFLSTSDRTFNVLPALFGSLPPGDPTFVSDVSKTPYHFSMIRYLHENGYYTSFFYAGDPTFNHMDDFLQRQEVDYVLRYFGSNSKDVQALVDGYHWGHSDGDLFSRSFEVIDSLHKSPRLDIYLTLSLHSPFIPPDQDHFLAQVDDRLKTIDPAMPLRPDIVRYKNIFATIMYTDHALKDFFDKYRKRAGYQNTIFIITGDHGLPELNLHRFSGLAHYNVPLIIFSPMLKKSALLRSVSSHLDVTPTILAMMRGKYNIKTRALAPWLGSGIDTTVAPRNIHTLPFILNNKEILEYVDNSYYLFRDTIRKILPEMWLKDTTDQATQRKMSRELADFKILNTYVTKQNMLVPREIYFRKGIDSVNVLIRDSISFNPNDSTSEYYSFFNKLSIPTKIKFLKLEITLDVLTPETDFSKAPMVVFDLYGDKKKRLTWQSFDFPCHQLKPARPGEWKTMKMVEYVELSYLQHSGDYSLMLYIWNKSRCIVRFNHPKVKITGYY